MGDVAVRGRNGGNSAGGVTAHPIALPVSHEIGDKIPVSLCTDGQPTITWPAGWDLVFEALLPGAAATLSVYEHTVDGTEAWYQDAAPEITVITSVAEGSAHHSWSLLNHSGAPAEWGGTAGGTTGTAPNPGAITPSWGAKAGTLFIANGGNDGQVTATGYPTGYTQGRNDLWANPNGAGVYSAERTAETVTEDPDAFTLSGSEQWGCGVIAIEPSAGGGGGKQAGALIGFSGFGEEF